MITSMAAEATSTKTMTTLESLVNDANKLLPHKHLPPPFDEYLVILHLDKVWKISSRCNKQYRNTALFRGQYWKYVPSRGFRGQYWEVWDDFYSPRGNDGMNLPRARRARGMFELQSVLPEGWIKIVSGLPILPEGPLQGTYFQYCPRERSSIAITI